MKDDTRLPEPSEVEPPLQELTRLRELSRFTVPTARLQRAMYTRIRATLDNDTPHAARSAGKTRARSWLLALTFTVAVPSAFAATPTGALVVQHTVRWATQVWSLVDPSVEPLERRANAVHSRETRESTSVVQASASTTPQPAEAPSAESSQSFTPLVVPTSSPATAATVHIKPGHNNARIVEPSESQRQTRPSDATAASGTNDLAAENSSLSFLTERQLLEAARLRLRAGDTEGARALTTRHVRQFPRGTLATEREAILRRANELESRRP